MCESLVMKAGQILRSREAMELAGSFSLSHVLKSIKLIIINI